MSIIQIDPKDSVISASFAGASVSWELTDTVVHKDLCTDLAANGLDQQPEVSSPAAALYRLLCELYQTRNCLVKSVGKSTKAPVYAVMPRKDQGTRVAFVEEWTVHIAYREDKTPYLIFSDGAPEDATDEVNVLYPSALEQLGRQEQSIWLSNFVKQYLHGVPTVGGAGTYFIGPKEVPTWRKLKVVLHKHNIRLYEIPAMRSDQALDCVIESVKKYTTAALQELSDDYKRYAEQQQRIDNGEQGARKIQQRAMESRLSRLNHQLTVVEKYEALFDTKLVELRDEIDKLRAGFGAMSTID